jgi:transposase
MSDGAELPDDVQTLQALLAEAHAQLAERDLEIEQLRAHIDKLKRMQFGRKSEQLDREVTRLETQFENLTAERGVVDVRRARQSGANALAGAPKEALPPHLLREEHVLEAELTCPKCGTAMQPLGEDISEQLARVAAMFAVIRTIRRKTVCPCGKHISQAPMSGLPITRSIAHPSLLADILVAKYADHTPLYRQSQIAGRDGVKLDPASMGRWVGQCEALCEPLTEALRRYTTTTPKLHADDTPIPVLAPGNKKAKTGRLWVYVRDGEKFSSIRLTAKSTRILTTALALRSAR